MQTTSTTLTPRQVWRQAAVLSSAWVLTLLALVAIPGMRIVAVFGFVALFVAVAIRWAVAAMPHKPHKPRTAGAEALLRGRAASPRGRAAA